MAPRQTVELKDRFRVSRRGLILVVAATLVAVAAALIVVLPIEPIYRTTAVVGTDPGAESANERVDFVADMRAAIFQPSVLDAVSDEVDIPRQELRSSLGVGGVDSSNLVLITYESTSPDGELPERVVTLVPVKALEFLNRGEVASATAAVEALELELAEASDDERTAQSDVTAAVEANNFIPPDIALDTLQRQLAEMRIQLSSLNASDPERDDVQSAMAQLEAQIVPATDRAATFATLVAARDDAGLRRNDIEAELDDARTALREAEIEPSVTSQLVAEERSPLKSAIVQVVAMAGVVLLGSLLLVSWWERRRDAAATTAGLSGRRAEASDAPPVRVGSHRTD